MALTNAQYDTIIQGYNRRRLNARKLQEERTKEIYDKLPEYKNLDELTATLAIEQGKKRLMGDGGSADELKDILEDLNRQKKLLLTAAGYSVNYLDPIYTCSYCKDTGFIDGQKCHCFKQEMLDMLYEQSNIREVLANESFDDISFDYQQGDDLTRLQNAVTHAKNFVKNFDLDYQNLLFYGTVGTGKSFLSNCIASELIKKGHSVIYFSSGDLFAKISEYAFRKNGKTSDTNPYEEIYNCDLLVLDDLGTELTNSFVISQLFTCLNERHLRRKSTIISTNLAMEDLRDRYDDRIFSRIISNYDVCKLSGQDVRIYKKRMMNRK